MLFQILTLLLLAEPVPVYRGEVDLPGEVFTADGASITRGKHPLEVRMQGDRYTLVVAGPEKQSASLEGVPFTGLDWFVRPVVGTILLWSAKEPPAEESRSKLSPYLTNVDWRATLRLYRSTDPQNEELRAVLADGPKRIQFTLFSSKPAKPARKP
jgi:hypothetical protein